MKGFTSFFPTNVHTAGLSIANTKITDSDSLGALACSHDGLHSVREIAATDQASAILLPNNKQIGTARFPSAMRPPSLHPAPVGLRPSVRKEDLVECGKDGACLPDADR